MAGKKKKSKIIIEIDDEKGWPFVVKVTLGENDHPILVQALVLFLRTYFSGLKKYPLKITRGVGKYLITKGICEDNKNNKS